MFKNLSLLIKKYGGEWVALEPNKRIVVSSGKTAKQVYASAVKKGVKIPTLYKVPAKYLPNVGNAI